MTSFALPVTGGENKALFADARGASDWLAAQPQANAPAMLAALTQQIDALNRFSLPARERVKILEVLRSAIFGASSEGQRRYENKPLPLLPVENDLLVATLCLWRIYRTACLHCLHACLQRDGSVAEYGAQVAHRALACLRMEQKNAYLANAEIDGDFWQAAHAVFAAAEQLGVTRDPVEDRLLAETSDSTVTGQYCMLLLLHLSTPFALTMNQLTAATRWLARWREQAMVVSVSQANTQARGLPIDLAQNRPFNALENGTSALSSGNARWLVVKGILRKMSQRIELLAAGQSPEELKLGSGISAEACTSLLALLADRLTRVPALPAPFTANLAAAETLSAAAGLETIYHLLAGRGLDDASESSAFDNRLRADQISVFGHVVAESAAQKGRQAETWRVARSEGALLELLRPRECGGARLVLQGLLAVKMEAAGSYRLAIIHRLSSVSGGSLCVTAVLFPGEPEPIVAEVREKPAGKISRHPAFLLPAGKTGVPLSIILPLGLRGRGLSIRFQESQTQARLNYKLVEALARGGDNERWSAASG